MGFLVLVYPGFLSYNSIEQFGEMRTGYYTDRYSPLMTLVWSACETVLAGPLSMLVLQSGMFVVGTAAILGRVLAPKPAAIATICVLMVPPVASVMGVIWLEPMMVGALLLATAGALAARPGWRIAGALALVLACSCHAEVVLAAIPLALIAFAAQPLVRRIGYAIATVAVLALVTRGIDWVLVDHDTDQWAVDLMTSDVVGSIRKSKASDAELEAMLGNLPVAVHGAELGDRIRKSSAFDPLSLVAGDHRVIDRPSTDFDRAALREAWHATIGDRFAGYLTHRYLISKRLLGFGGSAQIFDSLGDPDHMVVLHHRATPSDVQDAMQWYLHLFAFLMRPWLWLILAIVASVLVRGRVIRLVIASGIVWEISLFVFAPIADYRLSLWLVATAVLGAAAAIATRRASWRAT
ncbi:MAG: hypothetical protein ABI867_32935 [Kofleriaceae bacterium]